MKKIILMILLIASTIYASAQLNISTTSNYTQLVNNFILSGVSASNVVYTGASNAIGSFSNGNTTNINMPDGIILTTGTVNSSPAIGSPVANFLSTSNGTAGDVLLNALIPGFTTYDAAILEFDLVPNGNILEFQYVFASEEYPEFVFSSFNDVFGFFINGPNPTGGNYTDHNIALIPGSNSVVSINNVNASTNASFFIDNQFVNPGTIAFDGFTTVLNAQLAVTPGQTYHLKMAVGDAGDGVFDSGIFLKAQSMKSYILTGINEQSEQIITVPNPLHENNIIGIKIYKPCKILMQLFDYSGKEVKSLTCEYSSAGLYNINAGYLCNGMLSGVYFLSTTIQGKRQTQKLFIE